jgi:3-isopropylmalate dehydrogenase
VPKLAVIPGDGVGPEVINEALKVLDVVGPVFGLDIEVEMMPYGAEHYLATGDTIPPVEAQRMASDFAGVLVGPFGDPRVPGGEHARDILHTLRGALDLYVDERPARLLHERLTPLRGRRAEDVDLVVFREATEGLYAGIGGVHKHGSPDEVAVAEELHTRRGVERVVRHAFEWARASGKTRVTMADQANVVQAHMLWRRVFEDVGREFRDVRRDARYVDELARELVREPQAFQVIVTGSLYGDFLANLAAALAGGLGVAPSAGRHAEHPALFAPAHGSVPALARTDTANPMAAILALAMMLASLRAGDAAKMVERAVAAAVAEHVTTPDLGGEYGTRAVGEWIAEWIRVMS